MSVKIYVPGDAAALSVGAEGVARAIGEQIASRRARCHGGSQRFARDVLAGAAGRSGNASRPRSLTVRFPPSRCRALFDAGFLEGKPHRFVSGLTEEIPYLKNQERLTFARCGITDPLSLSDYISHGGYRGLENAHSS